MKKTLLTLIIIMLAVSYVYASSAGTADPSDLGVGARPLAMGKSFVGMTDDASCIFINPAGLGSIKAPKATSMSGQVIQDINYTVLSAATPTDYGTFGIGYINVGLPNIPVTQITGSGTTAAVVPLGSTNYFASVTTLSYSNDISKIDWFRDQKGMTYGINMKYFTQGFNGGGSKIDNAGGTGFDMDLGLQYRPRKEITLGLSAINILNEGLGGQFIWTTGAVEGIPALVKFGGTARVFGDDSFYGGKQTLLVGLDMDMHPTQNRQSVYHVGVEWWPISVMALRIGLDQKPKGTESGVSIDNNLTAGIGLKYNGFTFDYCYHQYSDLSDNVTHYFSLGYVGEEKPKVVEQPKRVIPVVVASVSLETFDDVTPGYWAKSPIEFMATLGIMNGYYDKKFRPDDSVTRAEFASMLIKLKGVEMNEATSDPFPDVNKDHWAAKYIRTSSYLGFMNTYPDGTFRPDNKLTRVEGVVILSRFTEAPEPKELSKDPFQDVSKGHWAAKQITSAQNYGILDYLIGKKFDPNRELTRAEIAEMLSKTSYGKNRIRRYLQMGAI